MKRILITYTSFGNGHRIASEALLEGFKEYHPNEKVYVVDLLHAYNEKVNSVSISAYHVLASHVPWLYDLIMAVTNSRRLTEVLNKAYTLFAEKKLRQVISEFKPDIIVSTFPLWNSLIRRVVGRNTPLVTVVTDNGSVHGSWFTGQPCALIVPNQWTADKITRRYPRVRSEVLPYGFPLRLQFDSFFRDTDRKFHLSSRSRAKHTLLFVLGWQSTTEDLNWILGLDAVLAPTKYHGIILFSGNTELYSTFLGIKTSLEYEKLLWTEDMIRVYASADLYIGKAGGTTTIECMYAGLPMLVTKMPVFQERPNVELVESNDVGFCVAGKSFDEVASVIAALVVKKKSMSQKFSSLAPRNATKNICSFIAKLEKGGSVAV